MYHTVPLRFTWTERKGSHSLHSIQRTCRHRAHISNGVTQSGDNILNFYHFAGKSAPAASAHSPCEKYAEAQNVWLHKQDDIACKETCTRFATWSQTERKDICNVGVCEFKAGKSMKAITAPVCYKAPSYRTVVGSEYQYLSFSNKSLQTQIFMWKPHWAHGCFTAVMLRLTL